MNGSKLFFGSLAAATLLPLIGLSLGAAPYLPGLAVLIAVTGYWHVSSTGFSYFDPDFRPLVKAEPWRFIAPLIVLPLAMVTLYVINPALGRLSVVGYLFWQGYHYQRQNYGLCALAGGGRLPQSLNAGFNMVAIAGTLGLVRFSDVSQIHLSPELAAAALAIASAIYLGGVILVALSVAREPRLQAGRPFLFVVMSSAFFLPSLVCDNPMAAFWSYAAAHGAQYLICQGTVAIRSGMSRPRFAAGFAIMAAVGTLGYFSVGHPLLMQAWLGVVMVHFLADAKLWRLREPLQRQTIQRRFDFLFSPTTSRAHIGAPSPS